MKACSVSFGKPERGSERRQANELRITSKNSKTAQKPLEAILSKGVFADSEEMTLWASEPF